jgi:hypothetical protein
MSWQVDLKGRVRKSLDNRRKIPLPIAKATFFLITELKEFGPAVHWPNYGKLKNQGQGIDRRHCHLQKGRPTWVACWEVHAKHKKIEVYYVGTHEKAPY